MPKIHNNNRFCQIRKELRKRATIEESLLWEQVRNRRLGIKFYRQHSIGPYIVDFYCPKACLIIELDGDQHKENRDYDLERTRYLNSLNFIVIRFWNQEVVNNIEKILQKTKEVIMVSQNK